MLSPSGRADRPPAELRSATGSVPMEGTIGGAAELGKSALDPFDNVIVPVTSLGAGDLFASGSSGLVSLTESHEAVILASTGYTRALVRDGRATITTSDGDRLSLAFGGSGVRTPYGSNDTIFYAILDGTGRFAGASGGGVISATDEPGDPEAPDQVPFLLDLEGVIATVGSSDP